MDDHLFRLAEKIAHGYFWMSDDPKVMERARNRIKSQCALGIIPEDNALAYYVAVICREASGAEIELIEKDCY